MKNNREKSIFVCNSCGNEFSTWAGRCSACGEWNTLKEMSAEIGKLETVGEKISAKNLSDYKITNNNRIKTGYPEIDQVFGGGIVVGSVILLGGEPGIGKSTLLLQIVAGISNTLYLSGEESPEQIKMRAERTSVKSKNVLVSEIADISGLEQAIIELEPKIIVVDSIQTIFDSRVSGTAGSPTQVKESGLALQQLAKKHKVPIVIVGHVTKEGTVAGPKMLEHLVDVVVYMEGDRNYQARILRAVKNRFGNTDEIAVLSMGENGLVEVKNPGVIFLSERKNSAGSAVTVLMEGSRPLLIEIQALTTPTTFGYPRRTTSGFDLNRLNILIGVITKRAGLNLGNQDIYLNIVGGISTSEPAADLAVALAIASSFKNKPLIDRTAFIGEVGLTGEVRKVANADKRKKEADKLGYKVASNYREIREAIEKSLI